MDGIGGGPLLQLKIGEEGFEFVGEGESALVADLFAGDEDDTIEAKFFDGTVFFEEIVEAERGDDVDLLGSGNKTVLGLENRDRAEMVVGVEVRNVEDADGFEGLFKFCGGEEAAELADCVFTTVEHDAADAGDADEGGGDIAVAGGDGGTGTESEDFGIAAGENGWLEGGGFEAGVDGFAGIVEFRTKFAETIERFLGVKDGIECLEFIVPSRLDHPSVAPFSRDRTRRR